ncbi:hypothetical protein QJS66_10155 [Kocuria rhizophila]|nr:hypothetical protein QJS66_10155 [Kocuria rhizophila]
MERAPTSCWPRAVTAPSARSPSLAGGDVPRPWCRWAPGNLLAPDLEADLADPHHSVDVALFGSERSIDTVVMHLRPLSSHAGPPLPGHGRCGLRRALMADQKDNLRTSWAGPRTRRRGRATVRRPGGPPASAWTVGRRVAPGALRHDLQLRELTAGSCWCRRQLDDGFLDLVAMTPRSVVGGCA